MSIFEWISLIGSIASILGLLLYFLDKKEVVSVKLPLKYLFLIIIVTVIFIGISLWKSQNQVTIKQDKNNDNNKIEVIIPEK